MRNLLSFLRELKWYAGIVVRTSRPLWSGQAGKVGELWPRICHIGRWKGILVIARFCGTYHPPSQSSWYIFTFMAIICRCERPKRGRCRQRLWVMKGGFIAKEKKSVSCWKASLRHNWELVCVAGLTTSRIQNTPEISIYASLDAWPTKLNYTELGMYCTLGFTIVVF